MQREDKIREYYQQQVKNALENKSGIENCKREPVQWHYEEIDYKSLDYIPFNRIIEENFWDLVITDKEKIK